MFIIYVFDIVKLIFNNSIITYNIFCTGEAVRISYLNPYLTIGMKEIAKHVKMTNVCKNLINNMNNMYIVKVYSICQCSCLKFVVNWNIFYTGCENYNFSTAQRILFNRNYVLTCLYCSTPCILKEIQNCYISYCNILAASCCIYHARDFWNPF